MRIHILSISFLFFFSFYQADPTNTGKKYIVKGSVTETRKYCGGARPTDEIVAKFSAAKPLANKKIFIKKGEVNNFKSKVIAITRTDSIGNFSLKLRPGKYLVVDSTKSDLSYYTELITKYTVQTRFYEATDVECLKEWYKVPASVFEVSPSDTQKVTVNFHKGCEEDLPCTRFRGPYRQ